MADNYIVKDTKKLTSSDGQFSFRSEVNKEVQRVRNTITTDGETDILGAGNYIANSVKKTKIVGSNNFVSADADITGNNNKVDSNAIVIGDSNIISSDATKSLIIGNNIIATQSNTVYLDNLIIPNGGTLNGNSVIGAKKYIFRLNYNSDTFLDQSYSLIYTNDISSNVFSYSIDQPIEGAGRLVFNIVSDQPIFGDRTVIKSTLIDGKIIFFDEFGQTSYWDADIPFSTKKVDANNMNLSCYSYTTLPFSIPEMSEYLGATHTPTSYQVYSITADIEIDVYDEIPSVPQPLTFNEYIGDISSVYGLTYSIDTGLIGFENLPVGVTFSALTITQVYSPTIETNIITAKVNDVLKQTDSYVTGMDQYFEYPIELGTYKWFMNSSPLYSATYTLGVGDVTFSGSINYITPPVPLDLNIIDWNTATGDLDGSNPDVYVSLTTDSLIVDVFPLVTDITLTVDDTSGLLTKPDYNVYVFRKIGTGATELYSSYMNCNDLFTVSITDTLSYDFFGEWTFFIEAEIGSTFVANLAVTGNSGFYGEADYTPNIPTPTIPRVDFLYTSSDISFAVGNVISDSMTIGTNNIMQLFRVSWSGHYGWEVPGSYVEVYRDGLLYETLYQTSSNYMFPQDVTDDGNFWIGTWTFYIFINNYYSPSEITTGVIFYDGFNTAGLST